MSTNFDKNLILNLKGSWAIGGILVVLHVGALIIAAIVPLSWALRLALLGLIAVSLYHSLIRYALHQGRGAIRWAQLDGDGEWHLGLGNTEALGPCSVKGHYAKPWLIIVRLAYPGKRLPLTLVITRDAVDHDAFHNLHVRLNLEGPEN